MIPYDLDPSLYATEPDQAVLDDGFSPPHHDAHHDDTHRAPGDVDVKGEIADDGEPGTADAEPALGPKSLF